MAAGGGQPMEETPTWAAVVVCFVLVAISIIIENIIHSIGKWLKNNHKVAFHEALKMIKSELTLLGPILSLLTARQAPTSKICISKALRKTWHPCENKQEESKNGKHRAKLEGSERRGLLAFQDYIENHEQILAAAGYDKCAEKSYKFNMAKHSVSHLISHTECAENLLSTCKEAHIEKVKSRIMRNSTSAATTKNSILCKQEYQTANEHQLKENEYLKLPLYIYLVDSTYYSSPQRRKKPKL